MQKVYIPTDIFIRIRPFASSGFHGQATVVADKGVKVSSENKRIENYTEKTVTIKDEGTSKSTPFNYAKSVIQPETNQNDFFEKAELPTKINHFLNGQNCACIAFGQTGSGKTHTMFGPPSLDDQINQIDIEHVDLVNGQGFPENWGIFARTILGCMAKIKQLEKSGQNGYKFKLTATIIELYFMKVFDLLNDKCIVPTTKYGGGEFDFGGVTEIPVDGVEDVAKLAKTIMNERRATSTNVNDSSSRSHCIATLNLICVKDGNAGKEVRRNSFTFADLSGSERVSKTGFEKASTEGFEGILINYELTQFGITIDNMVKQHLKNRRHKTNKQPAKNSDSMLARLLSGIIGGKAIACMIVCLSQSDNNGNESYCSLRFGERLAKLSVPFPETEKWFDMKKKLASLNKELKEQEDALKKIDSTNQYFAKRTARMKGLKCEIDFLGTVDG